MAAIRYRGNRSTERAFASLLKRHGIAGWKRHERTVTGKPDFYFPTLRVAIFIDGCFWHGCPRCFQAPRQNGPFWVKKIAKNRRRDRKVVSCLRAEGVRVIRVWEHELEKRSDRLLRILRELHRVDGKSH